MSSQSYLVCGIAEVSLRVHDLAVMRAFYEDVIGLEVFREFDDAAGKYVFYSIGDRDKADGQNIALFQETMKGWVERDRDPLVDVRRTTLHHIGLRILAEDFDGMKARLERLGIEISHPDSVSWMSARMFYVVDPERNVIEFLSYIESPTG